MTWTPIVSPQSDLGIQARDAIQSIAQTIANQSYEMAPSMKQRSRNYEEALLYGYLGLAFDDQGWTDRAAECLNQAIDNAPRGMRSLGLFGGLTGLGWTVEHISRVLRQVPISSDGMQSKSALEPDGSDDEGPEEEEDLNTEVDAAVLRNLPNTDCCCPYDLVSGLVGYGTYFLERVPKETAIIGTTAVFDRLAMLAERANAGITWHSGPELLPDWQRERYPEGYYNLGVAHGIPGIIHFLSEISETHIVQQERSKTLLESAVNWLIAQKRPQGSLSRFSSWVVPGQESTDSRLAWCYGDLGILAVLWQVAYRANRSDWRQFAYVLLNHCLDWPPDRTGIADAPLCHGAAGVAHIFNRIYQTEGDPRCLGAALLWYERTLAFRQPGKGVGGFLSLTRPDPNSSPIWESSPAFLDGSIGIALALLAALTPVEPGWDRALLLSGR